MFTNRLSSDLYTGITLASFNLWGKIPVSNDLLNIKESGSEIWVITFLITVVEKPSKPIPLLFFKLLTISVISCVVHGLRNMEFLLGAGKVSLISPAVSWGIALARFGPIFTK